MAWQACSAWGGGAAGSSADRARLPKGQEECHICGADSPVEIKLQPCKHELCLGCVNSMRNANILRPDAGLKCPFCREFVDGFTDMNGRRDTIKELVEANQAARKSMLARRSGAEKAVLTGVPDPQRLVPPVAPRREAAAAAEPSWACPHCRHVNPGGKAECTRCRLDNPAHPRASAYKDPLTATEEDLVRAACERLHPGLNRAFLEAGTPWSNGGISGSPEAIRRALRSKGHERLMRVVHLLTSGGQLERVATDLHGNYALQDLLEALHLLRQQAVELQKQGTPPLETFTALPSSSPCKAMKAFSEMLRFTIPLLHPLATSERGVYVLLRLLKLGSPLEVAYVAEQAAPNLMECMLTKEGTLFVCQLVERLSVVASESTPSNAAKATEALGQICSQLCAHSRALVQSARHQHLGPCLVQLVQGALPRIDAFKVGYQLAINSGFLCQARSGSRTLELLLQMKGGDLLCREMIRDMGCYAAKALQGQFGQLAARSEQDAQRAVRALLGLLLAEREDEWLRQITEEVVAAGADFRGNSDGLDVLAHCLALPLFSPPEAQRHWAALESTPLDIGVLRQLVQAAKAGQQRLPGRLHKELSEVQPTTPPEGLRRFPHYVRDGALQQPRHSMLKRPASLEEPLQPGAGSSAAAGAAPAGLPPPPPPRAPTAAKAAPPGFAAAGAAAAAGAPQVKPAAPPGFAVGGAGAGAATASAAKPGENGTVVVFLDGTRVPMPQPYSAPTASNSSAADAAADQAGSSSQSAAPPPPPPPRTQPQAVAQPAGSSSSNSSATTAAAPTAAPAPAPLPSPRPPMQQPAFPALNASAPAFSQPVQQAARPALSAAALAFSQPQPGMSASAPPFSLPHPGMSAAAPPFVQAVPRSALSAAAPAFVQPQGSALPPHMLPPGLQPGAPASQPAQALPPHLAALPPHLLPRAQPAAAASSSGTPTSSMPAPATPPQHAPAFAQPAATPHLPSPLMAALLPPTFRPAGMGPPAATAAAPQQLPQPARPAAPPAAAGSAAQLSRLESTGSSAGPTGVAAPAAPAASAGVFGGFSSLTEMLSELTATTAPQPVAPRPAAAPYRPAYRPPAAYRPPGAAAPAPAAPAARPPMPMPAAPAPRPAAPAPAPAAPAAPAPLRAPEAGPWACRVCSYRHEGGEAEFLCCAMCGTTRVG